MALSKRLLLTARALVEQGCLCTVMHVGGSPFKGNSPAGEINGVRYRYYPGVTDRVNGRLHRIWINLKGIFLAVRAINNMGRNQRVCVYSCNGAHQPFLRMLRTTRIIECNEWFPEIKRRLSRLWIFPAADAFVVISDQICANIKACYARSKPIFQMPILVDHNAWAASDTGKDGDPYFFWCGSAEGYGVKDVRFILKAFSEMQQKFSRCCLKMSGKFPKDTLDLVSKDCRELNIPANRAQILGFVSSDELRSLVANASALLLPLWNEERSANRFPTKLGEYLATGRPVITARVGAVAHYCNADNSILYSPGDYRGFSQGMHFALESPDKTEALGVRGAELSKATFDYSAYGQPLCEFIGSVIEKDEGK